MVFVRLDASLLDVWVVFWMLYGPIGRFLNVVWSDGALFRCCMVRFKRYKKPLGVPLI